MPAGGHTTVIQRILERRAGRATLSSGWACYHTELYEFDDDGMRFGLIGCAVGAVQTLPDGIYIAMNGRIWDPARVRKNRDANRFEAASGQ